MGKKKILFENDSDGDKESLSINKAFAKCYDDYRSKEEMQKYKDRFGEVNLSGSNSSDESSDESDDTDAENVLDEEFFTTLSHIKSKNPIIYDKNALFSSSKESDNYKGSKKKEKSVSLRDYERNMLLAEGRSSIPGTSKTYVQEQQEIKSAFKEFLGSSDSEDESLLKKRDIPNDSKEDSESYIKFLRGEGKVGLDDDLKSNLKPLHEFWNDPKLDSSEQFLKDYILNKRFLDKDDESYIPAYDEIVHESDENLSADEETLNEQAQFEEKYNFRFEEPDPVFIKRYPRTMEDSMRRKDSKRKEKRDKYKERKEDEKIRKREEMKQLKALKRKEILDKLQQISDVTGNPNVFSELDLDADFDPEAHDNKMKETFSEQFYSHDDHEKPVFSDEDMEDACDDDIDENDESIPGTSQSSKIRNNRFYSMIKSKKPQFDSAQQDFDEYLEEYYKLDFEDLIGDIPCRFKYRKVVPNDFGLDTEEILLSKEKELNKWCSLKKAIQYKSTEEQEQEVANYSRRKENVGLKKKILTSLFSDDNDADNSTNKGAKKKKKSSELPISDNRLKAYGLNPRRYKNKLKYNK